MNVRHGLRRNTSHEPPLGIALDAGALGIESEKRRPVVGHAAFVRPYRPFYRRPWFGTVIGGVVLGTILTAAAVGVAPAYAPAPNLCWYWSDPGLTQGFWDYCAPPY